VEERSSSRTTGARGAYQLTADGKYRVRRGDSLHAIAFNFGLDWRDLAGWNSIPAPYTIYPDQELRLSPPRAQPSREVVTRPAPPPAGAVSSERPASSPVSQPSEPVAEDRPAGGNAAAAPPPNPPAAAIPEPKTAAAPPLRDPERWLWPAEGRLISRFQSNDPARNGIDIGGTEGQPVRAAAAGEVVYSGNGLIGYGELVIVKHSDRMLSAYAHNRRRLVTEGQRVAAGEQLAEMGRNDRNQVLLHFEIRVNGTPQDPLKYLPGR
jgi:lipoprotein NlpD